MALDSSRNLILTKLRYIETTEIFPTFGDIVLLFTSNGRRPISSSRNLQNMNERSAFLAEVSFRGRLSAVPMSVLLLFLPLFSFQ